MSSANLVMLVGVVKDIDPKENAIRFTLETQDIHNTKVFTQSSLIVYRGAMADEVARQISPGAKVYCGGKISSTMIPNKDKKEDKLVYVNAKEFELL